MKRIKSVFQLINLSDKKIAFVLKRQVMYVMSTAEDLECLTL